MLFQMVSITSPMEGLFGLKPHPFQNSSLVSYLTLRILAFEIPHPLRVTNDHPWGGYGYFLELHNR